MLVSIDCKQGSVETLPVDEVLLLQVLHGGGDLCGHVEQHYGSHLLTVTLTQVVQEVPMGHVLSHDVEGGLKCAHTLKLDGDINTHIKTKYGHKCSLQSENF